MGDTRRFGGKYAAVNHPGQPSEPGLRFCRASVYGTEGYWFEPSGVYRVYMDRMGPDSQKANGAGWVDLAGDVATLWGYGKNADRPED